MAQGAATAVHTAKAMEIPRNGSVPTCATPKAAISKTLTAVRRKRQSLVTSLFYKEFFVIVTELAVPP
jgi:hypothetical protein